MNLRLLRMLGLLGTLSLSTTVEAQGAAALAAPPVVSEPSPELLHAHRGRPDSGVGREVSVWTEVGVFSGDYDARGEGGSFTLVSTDLGVSFGLEDEARISLDWGVAYGLGHMVGSYPRAGGEPPLAYDASVERIEARNPVIALDWIPWLGTNTRLSLGLALAIPSAAIQTYGNALQVGPQTEEQAAIFQASRVAHDVWLASNGGWASWRYLPERVSVVLPLSLLLDVGPVEVAIDGVLGVCAPVLGGTGDVDGLAQAAVELYGTASRFNGGGVSLGARLSIAASHVGADTAFAQPALEPWLRVDVRPAFLTLRGTLNVGDPYGLGNPTGVWALHVGGGIALDGSH